MQQHMLFLKSNSDFSLNISLPFYLCLSKPLKKILEQHNVKVTVSSFNTLCDLLSSHKDKDHSSPSLHSQLNFNDLDLKPLTVKLTVP